MIHDTFGKPDRAEQRHSPNRRRTRVAAVAEVEGVLHPVTILDVNLEGMKLSVPVQILPGTALTLRVMQLELPAIVHWYRVGHIGIHLLDRMDGKTLRALEAADDDLAEFR